MNAITLIILFGVLACVLCAPFFLVVLRERYRPYQLATGKDGVADKNFVLAHGYTIHYTDEGPHDDGSGRVDAVVLLHGFAAWGFTWRNQTKALLNAGYRVITIDQLGCGASQRAATLAYTTQHQAEYMLAVLDSLGIQSAHWVGHSYGGRVAMQVALHAPQRVRKLIGIAPEAFATARPPIAKIVTIPFFGYILGFYSTLLAFVGPTLAGISKQRRWVNRESVNGYKRSLRVWGNLLAQIYMSKSPKDRGDLNVPEHLAHIAHPTLFIWGDGDPVFPASDGEKLLHLLPHAQLKVLPKVGHLPHEEMADVVSHEIIDFLLMK
jgi:pimeloyl-ACP methyl ester carboxylesterase